MANNSQNLTNPNDMVDVNLLKYFEGKLGDKYASQAGLEEVEGRVSDKADDAVFTGASASAAGKRGLVPAPAAGDGNKYLRGDGTWSDDRPSAAFIGDALVFYSGGVFDGETLIVG